ncbi:MAG: FtsX-like permease family protein [Bacteroidales bacterium]
MKSGYQDAVEIDGEIYTTENLYYATPSYFTVFSPGFIYGDMESALAEPETIVLSERVARILFGNDNPVGKELLFNNKERLKVSGVLENPHSNTHLKVDYLVSFSLLEREGSFDKNWGSFNYLSYILLKPGADAATLNDKLEGYIQTKDPDVAGRLILNPLKRIYLFRDPGFDSPVYPSDNRGPVSRVILFAAIGIILLVIACINFVNLSTAYASARAREIGVRKVNGAGRRDLVVQLFLEALSQTFLAMVLALAIVVLLLPIFSQVSGLETDISSLFQPVNISIYILLALFTGFVAGFYPALVLSSFKPAKVIKPHSGDRLQGGGLRKFLVVVQFVLAVTFIFCILVMNRQLYFMQHSKLGFNDERVMVVYPKRGMCDVRLLAERISGIPGVNAAAVGGSVPVNMGNWTTVRRWEGNDSEKSLKFHRMEVDDNYFGLLEFELLSGREFLPGVSRPEVIVNETAIRDMEMDNPVGKSIWLGGNPFTIVGVVKDFHFHKLKQEVLPVFFMKTDKMWSELIFVKLDHGNHFQTVDRITKAVNQSIPGFPARFGFLDEEIDRYYDEERRVNTLVNSATILTIIISSIGLFSLTAFTVRKRWKEIGIRKAHGASSSNLLLLLHREFTGLVLISSLIALPTGWLIMKRWLMSYAYHIRLDVKFFLVSFLLITVIASATVIFHTLKASSINPADTLRSE